jgi:hypothetical protein
VGSETFSIEDAVETNRLFLIDYTGSVEIDHPNVFALERYDGLSELIDAIVHAPDDRVDSQFVTALHLDSLAYAFSTEEVAAVRPQFHDEVLNSGDMPIYILNPAAVPDEFTPIFTGHAETVLNLVSGGGRNRISPAAESQARTSRTSSGG